MGYPPRLNTVFCGDVRVFPSNISIWIRGLSQGGLPPSRSQGSLDAFKRTKSRGRRSWPFCPQAPCSNWNVSSSPALSWDPSHQLRWSSGFWTQHKLHQPGFLGLLCLTDGRSWDFLASIIACLNSYDKSPLRYLCIPSWLYFSGELWYYSLRIPGTLYAFCVLSTTTTFIWGRKLVDLLLWRGLADLPFLVSLHASSRLKDYSVISGIGQRGQPQILKPPHSVTCPWLQLPIFRTLSPVTPTPKER